MEKIKVEVNIAEINVNVISDIKMDEKVRHDYPKHGVSSNDEIPKEVLSMADKLADELGINPKSIHIINGGRLSEDDVKCCDGNCKDCKCDDNKESE